MIDPVRARHGLMKNGRITFNFRYKVDVVDQIEGGVN